LGAGSAGATKTFTYDANGNLTPDGSRTFEWDAQNQLVAVTVGTHRSEFTYNGGRRRVRIVEKENGVTQSDTKVLWCESDICEERAADGTTVTRRAFVYGEQVSGAGLFFTPDHLGSVAEVTDAAATLLARYAFDPWGRRTLTAGTDVTTVGFTGHRWHPTGSGWFAQYCLLDPAMGRWVTQDPLGLLDGPNRYAYVANNPMIRVDPDGRAGVIALPLTGNPAAAAVAALVIAIPLLLKLAKEKECEEARRRRCVERWEEEVAFCDGRYRGGTRAHIMCKDRANNRLWACMDKLPDPGPLDSAKWPE
jgi:RHS repeat-associated protein